MEDTTRESTATASAPLVVNSQSQNKTNRKYRIILSVIIFLLVVGGGWYGLYFSSGTGSKAQEKQTTHTPSFSPTQTPSNWKLYTNSKYSYSFRYPKEWEVVEAKKSVGNQKAWQGNFLLPQELQKVDFVQVPYNEVQGYFEIKVLPNPKHLSLDEWAKGYKVPLATDPTKNLAEIKGKTTLGGQEAVIIYMNGVSYPTENSVVSEYRGNIYFLQYLLIDPRGPNDSDMLEYKKDAEQMLSSFTFLK